MAHSTFLVEVLADRGRFFLCHVAAVEPQLCRAALSNTASFLVDLGEVEKIKMNTGICNNMGL